MIDDDRLALIDNIAAILEPPRLEPDEITKTMLAERTGMALHKAANLLKRGVLDEIMTVRKVKLDGKWTNAYREAHSVTDSV